MDKIAIFGGTFNPIHNGHIDFALRCVDEFSLNKVFLVPTNIPPHKCIHNSMNSRSRLRMCQIVANMYPSLKISDIEIKRGGLSYTYETIRYFKKKFPYSKLYLIVGADMFMTIETWKNSKEILSSVILCTAPRGNYVIDVLENYAYQLSKKEVETKILKFPTDDISSTGIREMVCKGKDISSFVPKEIAEHIKKMGWYREKV